MTIIVINYLSNLCANMISQSSGFLLDRMLDSCLVVLHDWLLCYFSSAGWQTAISSYRQWKRISIMFRKALLFTNKWKIHENSKIMDSLAI